MRLHWQKCVLSLPCNACVLRSEQFTASLQPLFPIFQKFCCEILGFLMFEPTLTIRLRSQSRS